jgi:hypothetical protein
VNVQADDKHKTEVQKLLYAEQNGNQILGVNDIHNYYQFDIKKTIMQKFDTLMLVCLTLIDQMVNESVSQVHLNQTAFMVGRGDLQINLSPKHNGPFYCSHSQNVTPYLSWMRKGRLQEGKYGLVYQVLGHVTCRSSYHPY